MYTNKKEMIFIDKNVSIWIKENSIWCNVKNSLYDKNIATINLFGSDFHFVDESGLKNFIKV